MSDRVEMWTCAMDVLQFGFKKSLYRQLGLRELIFIRKIWDFQILSSWNIGTRFRQPLPIKIGY